MRDGVTAAGVRLSVAAVGCGRRGHVHRYRRCQRTQIFTPTQDQVNRQLRVVVSYTDDNGTNETVTSAATTVVGDFIAANAASQTRRPATQADDLIFGGGGNDTLNGLGGSDTHIDGGAGIDISTAATATA